MAEAEREQLSALQEELGVATTREVPTLEYLQHLQHRLGQWLDGLLAGAGGGPVDERLLWAVLLVLPVVALGLAAAALLRRRRARRPPGRGPRPLDLPAVEADPQEHLDEAFARGDPRAALGALWARLGHALDAAGRGRWRADLTEREFVAEVTRADPEWTGLAELRELGRVVVRGVYGPEEPDLEQVRALLPRAEALARQAARPASPRPALERSTEGQSP